MSETPEIGGSAPASAAEKSRRVTGVIRKCDFAIRRATEFDTHPPLKGEGNGDAE